MTSDPDLRHVKKELRHKMEAARLVALTENPGAGLALRDQFLKHISLSGGQIISGYCARGSEMDPRFLIEALQARGHTLALPVVLGKGEPLSFHLYNPGDHLAPGAMGILEPLRTAQRVDPDVLLVPLLAFDRQGHRLGYGGGFYDRTLLTLHKLKAITALGLGFSCQEVPRVPVGPTDARLDKIVTETGVLVNSY